MTPNPQDRLKSIIERIETAYQTFDKVYAGPADERWLAWVHHLQELQELQESDKDFDPSLWTIAAHNLILKEGKIKPEWIIARNCFEARDMLKFYLQDTSAGEYLQQRHAYFYTKAKAPLARVPHEFVASYPYLKSIYTRSDRTGTVYQHVFNVDQRMGECKKPPDGTELSQLQFDIEEDWLFTQINEKLEKEGKAKLSEDEIKALKELKNTSNELIRKPQSAQEYLNKIKEKVKEKLSPPDVDKKLNEFFQGILPLQDTWPNLISNQAQKVEAIKAYFKKTYSCTGFGFNPPDFPQETDLISVIKIMRQEAIKQFEAKAEEEAKKVIGDNYDISDHYSSDYDSVKAYLPPRDILDGVIAKEQSRKEIQMNANSSYGKLITAIANHSANYPCLVVPPNFSLRKPSATTSQSVGGGNQFGIEQTSSRILVTEELELYSDTHGPSFKVKQDKDQISYFSDIPLTDPQATVVSAEHQIGPDEKLSLMYSMIQAALLNWKVGEAFNLNARNEEELREMLVILQESVHAYQKYDPKFKEFPLEHVTVPHLLRPVKSEVLAFYQDNDLKKIRQHPERAPEKMRQTFELLKAKIPDPLSSELQQKFDLGSEAIRVKLLASLDKKGKISANWMNENAADLSKVPRYKQKLQEIAKKSDGIFTEASKEKQEKYLQEAKELLYPKPEP